MKLSTPFHLITLAGCSLLPSIAAAANVPVAVEYLDNTTSVAPFLRGSDCDDQYLYGDYEDDIKSNSSSTSFFRRMLGASHGQGCWLMKPCNSGLSCHPWIHKCYHKPRRINEPCSAGYGCGSGLTCVSHVNVDCLQFYSVI